MNHVEHALHMQVADFLDLALPDDAIWWHTPNEGRRDAKTGAKLKRLGMRAGFPDICICYRGRLYAIELKAPGATLRKTQRETKRKLVRAGAICSVASSMEAVWGCLDGFGIPVKARIAA